MPRTIPIAPVAIKVTFRVAFKIAFLIIGLTACLAGLTSSAAASSARHHAAKHATATHASARGAAHPAARSTATHKTAHAAASPARSRHAESVRTSARSIRSSHASYTTRHASRPVMQPRSSAARRAHARIREDVARRRHRQHHETYFKPELQSTRLVIPAPLRGSHESLVHQNQMAEAEGLERILDDTDLQNRIAQGSLVPVPTSYALRINTDLPENRRYCRPWTAHFLADLSRAHAAKYPGSPLEVTSAVRTVEYQRHLRLVNGNAAAADGDIASPHLTGGTIDIGKQGLASREIGWIRSYLIPLEQKGQIDVEEEFKQSCFHISVYRTYSDKQPTATPAKTPVPADGTMLAIHGH